MKENIENLNKDQELNKNSDTEKLNEIEDLLKQSKEITNKQSTMDDSFESDEFHDPKDNIISNEH